MTGYSVKKIFTSYNNFVYLVEKEGVEYILKESTKDANALNEWKEKLPVPKIIEKTDKYLVLEKLSGETLKGRLTEKTAREFGKYVGMIHAKEKTRRGELLSHPKQFWKEELHDLIGYCHGDLSLMNFLAENETVTGILDWEFAGEGEIIKDTFHSVKTFFEKWKFKEEIAEEHNKYLRLPDNWKKVAIVQQWLSMKKNLSKIDRLQWKELNEEQTRERKEQVRIEWTENLSKLEELYKTI